MRRLGGWVLAATVLGACGLGPAPATTPTDLPPTLPTDHPATKPTDHPPTPALTPVAVDAPGNGTWIVVGGLEVDTVPGIAGKPTLREEAAAEVVAGELAAGRARMIGEHADAPALHRIDATFVPALVRVLGPAGSHDFEPREPVAAWVVVSEGRGSDGLYIGVGIVGNDGTPLATYVITPGVG